MKSQLLIFACSLWITPASAQFIWENLGGPFGSFQSYIYSYDDFAFIPERDYLYRTSDGISWEAKEISVSIGLAIYEDTLVNYYFDGDTSIGHLQLSIDNGETWAVKEIPNALDHHYVKIALCSHGLYFYKLDEDLLFRSTDLGSSWEIQPHQDIRGFDFFARSDKLYMMKERFLAQSDHEGETWSVITPPLAPGEYLQDVEAKANHIMAATTENSIWHSHNNGLTWNKTSIPPAWGYDLIHLVGNTTYIAANELILQSEDFGISWDTLVEVDSWYAPFQLGHAGETFIVSTEYKSMYYWDTTAYAIKPSNDGITKGYIADLSMTSDRIWTAGNLGVNSYDLNTGEWNEPAHIPEPTIRYDFITTNDNGWIATGSFYYGEFYLSDDHGNTWDKLTLEGQDVLGIWELQLLGNNIFIISDVLLRSSDKGEHWDWLFAFEDLIQTNIVFFQGRHYMGGQALLYSSDDDGITWDTITPPFRIWSLSAYGDDLFAVTHVNNATVLYMSKDGINWTFAGNGFPEDYPVSQFDYKDKGHFYRDQNYYYAFNADPGFRTYRSSVDNISWSLMPNEPQDFIGNHSYAFTNEMIYKGGMGLYQTEIESPFITSVSEIKKFSDDLFSIFPNPASTTIHIHFKPQEVEEGTLQILSIDGVLITSKKISKADNAVHLTNLPAGMYYALFSNSSIRSMEVFAKL